MLLIFCRDQGVEDMKYVYFRLIFIRENNKLSLQYQKISRCARYVHDSYYCICITRPVKIITLNMVF